MVEVFLWLLALCLIMAAIYLLRLDRRETQLTQLNLQKMRGNDLYYEVYTYLRYATKHSVESVDIGRDRVKVRFFYPEPGESRYDYALKGFRHLNPLQVQTLALLIETDFPIFKDKARYHFNRRRIPMPNGSKRYEYHYTIRNDYKTAICRAPFYSGRAQETLILKRNY